MRKIILLLIAVVALVWGFVSFSLRARIAKAAPAIAHEVADKLGAKVDIGDVDISLFPVAASLRNVRVARYEQAAHPFLTIESLRFDAAFWPLLTGKLEVREVVVEKPHVEILREQDGRQQSDLSDRLLASLAKVPFSVRVVDGSVVAEDRLVTPPRRLSAESITGTAAGAVEGALVAELAGRVLGSSDTATLRLKLVPAAGRTGGDSVTVDFEVKDGKAAAVKDAFVILRGVDFVDPVAFRFQASGLLGEKSTETVPAEPLPGKLIGSVGLKIAGLDDRLEFDTEVALDDTRYQVRSGKARWGGFAFETTGWVTHKIPQKISARLAFERFALAAAAERFGCPERWRPKGDMDLTIRVTGTTDEPLVRHEGKIESLSFDGLPGLPIKAAPVTITGALAAINTDISASLNLSNLEVGTARFDKELVGLNYWHDKLTFTSLDAPVYDGVANGAVAFWPKLSDKVEGGIICRDSDAETVLSNIAPRLALEIYGRCDGVAELRQDDEGVSVRGRMAFHSGRIAGPNWMRQLVAEALAASGRANALAAIASDAPATLADSGTRFSRVAIDFESRGGETTLSRVVVDADSASIRGRGAIAADGSVSIEGSLQPGQALSRAMTEQAPVLAEVKTTQGAVAVPFTLHADSSGSRLGATPAFREAVVAALSGRPVPPLEVIEVGPAAFGTTATLRQQFGR